MTAPCDACAVTPGGAALVVRDNYVYPFDPSYRNSKYRSIRQILMKFSNAGKFGREVGHEDQTWPIIKEILNI